MSLRILIDYQKWPFPCLVSVLIQHFQTAGCHSVITGFIACKWNPKTVLTKQWAWLSVPVLLCWNITPPGSWQHCKSHLHQEPLPDDQSNHPKAVTSFRNPQSDREVANRSACYVHILWHSATGRRRRKKENNKKSLMEGWEVRHTTYITWKLWGPGRVPARPPGKHLLDAWWFGMRRR